MDDSAKLPTERHFDPYEGDLDAQWAWKNFGGLTLDEAKAKFWERPEVYYEAFMFMGGKAFAFYYPLIDSYLRETPLLAPEDRDDRQAWILAQCIKHQFDGWNYPYVRHLKGKVIELCRFVRQNLSLFGADPEELNQIDEQWASLQTHLENSHK
ncbi:MAG: hypothetical protein ACTHK7_19110 [Aureliella sp.]